MFIAHIHRRYKTVSEAPNLAGKIQELLCDFASCDSASQALVVCWSMLQLLLASCSCQTDQFSRGGEQQHSIMLPKNYCFKKILVVFSFFEIFCTRVGNSERFGQGEFQWRGPKIAPKYENFSRALKRGKVKINRRRICSKHPDPHGHQNQSYFAWWFFQDFFQESSSADCNSN